MLTDGVAALNNILLKSKLFACKVFKFFHFNVSEFSASKRALLYMFLIYFIEKKFLSIVNSSSQKRNELNQFKSIEANFNFSFNFISETNPDSAILGYFGLT